MRAKVLLKLFLGSARLRFPGREQNALKWSCRPMDFQRTANSVLTVCVSPGDNPNLSSGRLSKRLFSTVEVFQMEGIRPWHNRRKK